MARRRLRVRVDAGRGPRVSLEWMGFRDAGAAANLVTSDTRFELVPPAGASAVVIPDLTILRIVGHVTIGQQAGVTTNTGCNFLIHKVNVGGDQTIDDTLTPASTDPDDFDHAGIMYWYGHPRAGLTNGPAADFDQSVRVIPIDIKTKRKLDKRDTLVLSARAAALNTLAMSVNLRVLTRTY